MVEPIPLADRWTEPENMSRQEFVKNAWNG
jgi:hypothetical protein